MKREHSNLLEKEKISTIQRKNAGQTEGRRGFKARKEPKKT